MAFNISQFKSTIDKYGGPAKSSLFEVIITKANEANSTLSGRDVTFFCTNVNMPGISINTQQFTAVGQMPINFPNTMENQPISAVFMVDSDHQVLTFFHNWIQKVLNYSTAEGSYAAIGEGSGNLQLPYELGYKDEYACTMVIKHYSVDSAGSKYYEVTLENVFPYSIGDIQLGWETNDQYTTVPIAFAYDRIYFSGDRTGKQTRRTGRGILETLGDLAGFADTVRQTLNQGKPQSIQDAVNRLNRVRNSASRLDSFFDNGGG
jgi:hypothetical protein